MPKPHNDDRAQGHQTSSPPPATPPAFADVLLNAFLGKDHGDIRGDMAERFQLLLETDGVQEARRLYWIGTLGCVWPIFVQALVRNLSRLVRIVLGTYRPYAYAEGWGPVPSRIPDNNTAIPPWLNGSLSVFYAACLMLVAWFFWTADCAYGMSLFFLGNLFAMVMVAFVSLPCFFARQWRRAATVMVLSGLALLLLSCVDQSVDKALNRLDRHIHPGMTRAQVEHLVSQYLPLHGRFGPPRWHSPSGPGTQVDTPVRTLTVGHGEMVFFFTPQGHVKSTYVQD